MKSVFKSFVVPTDKEIAAAWKNDSTLIIFDTSVLLNLYGFEEQTRKDFFSATTKLMDRIWIPYHVGLEYNLQRLSIINREKKIFRAIRDITDSINEKVDSAVNSLDTLKLKAKFPDIYKRSELLVENIKKEIDAFHSDIEPWNKKQPHVGSKDAVLDAIDKMTNGRIGAPPPDQEWLDDIFKEGEKRYQKLIPPGYKDDIKSKGEKLSPTFSYDGLLYERRFGDFIIWKQILAKVSDSSVKNVFLITDDTKEDWWSVIQAEGKRLIGPHPDLSQEISKIAGADFFHMYSTSKFLSTVRTMLNVKVSESSISDAHIKPDVKFLTNFKDHSTILNSELYQQIYNKESLRTDLINIINSPTKNFFSDLKKDFIRPEKYDPRSLKQSLEDFNNLNKITSLEDIVKEEISLQKALNDAEAAAEVRESIARIFSRWNASKTEDTPNDDYYDHDDDDDDDDPETVV